MRELDFSALEQKPEEASKVAPESASWRRKRRVENPPVQMSLRMREDVYERFRKLCMRERRTNGDMLEVLLVDYLKSKADSSE